jgi:hypothetical protein
LEIDDAFLLDDGIVEGKKLYTKYLEYREREREGEGGQTQCKLGTYISC